MLEFIKMFGMGILYTILSPFILLFFLVFVVYSVFNYLVFEVIYLGGFFLGKKFSVETPLEKKLAKMKAEKQSNNEVSVSADVERVSLAETNIENNEGGDLNG